VNSTVKSESTYQDVIFLPIVHELNIIRPKK